MRLKRFSCVLDLILILLSLRKYLIIKQLQEAPHKLNKLTVSVGRAESCLQSEFLRIFAFWSGYLLEVKKRPEKCGSSEYSGNPKNLVISGLSQKVSAQTCVRLSEFLSS